ncbi:MAG TPA: hypothetical protein VK186_18620 [Candidatus Deferrimicrobium sp.]|nr:hypothetical protein [Candidatus Kapabacteria bacterium]HLP60862.1 hypothetical protein [Candidatus Deferrimicrobium sp.]
MKKMIIFIGIMMMVASFGALQAQQVKKYQIQSGIITFETTLTMGKMVMKTKAIVYFDDFGMKECRDTYDYEGKAVKESFFSDGKNLYLVMYAEKTAYNRGVAYRGTEYKFDWNEIAPSGMAKKLPNMTVAGKNCEAFELNDKGNINTYAGWNNVCLYIATNQKNMNVVSRAIKFEENAKVPAEKFKIPAGFALK